MNQISLSSVSKDCVYRLVLYFLLIGRKLLSVLTTCLFTLLSSSVTCQCLLITPFCLMVSPQNITENVLINEAYWVSVTKEVLHLESFDDLIVKFLQDTREFL